MKNRAERSVSACLKLLAFAVMAAAIPCCAPARTSQDVTDEIGKVSQKIKELAKEQRSLCNKPVVKYAEEPGLLGELVRKVGKTIEIGKTGTTRRREEFKKWRKYNSQIEESEQRLARLDEIKDEIARLKNMMADLREERKSLKKKEKTAKCGDVNTSLAPEPPCAD